MSVERATLAIPGGGTANLDIPARTALGPTSSVLPIGSLARAALPFLVDLTDEEAQTIADLLASDSGQGDLLDEIDDAEVSDESDVKDAEEDPESGDKE